MYALLVRAFASFSLVIPCTLGDSCMNEPCAEALVGMTTLLSQTKQFVVDTWHLIGIIVRWHGL